MQSRDRGCEDEGVLNFGIMMNWLQWSLHTLKRIIIIIIIKGSKSRGGDITPNIFAHTPAGAESYLNAAAAASQAEITDLSCSDHSTTDQLRSVISA